VNHEYVKIEHWKNRSLENIAQEIDGIFYTESWSNIEEVDSLYSISNFGRLKRNEGFISVGNFKRKMKEKILCFSPKNDDKYIKVTLKKGNHEMVNTSVHRLVGKYYVPNPDNKPEINHFDGIKWNNIWVNLFWETQLDNIIHAKEHGLDKQIGETHHKCVLNKEIVVDIFNSPLSNKELAEKYSISRTTAYDIKNGGSWSHVTGKTSENISRKGKIKILSISNV
jgi:hypothetical protein